MTTEPVDLQAYIEATAPLIGIDIDKADRSQLCATLAVILKAGAFVAEFTLPDDAEPAPVFTVGDVA